MANFVKHEACPACGSNNNLARYDDGSAYCFGVSCGYKERGDGAVPELEPAKRTLPLLEGGRTMPLRSRGIREDICAKYGYKTGTDEKGNAVHIAPYHDPKTGKLIAQKLRYADKRMQVRGQGKDMPLFGMKAWTPTEKVFVVVTEGEIDALSVCQAQGGKYPVVSVPAGSSSAGAAIKRHIDWLHGFKHVVLCFDEDEAGRAAVTECVDLFQPGKVRVASLPMKDANEMVVSGHEDALRQAVWDAAEYRPDGVIGIQDILQRGLEPPEEGLSWPWPTLTRLTYGIRLGNIYTVGAGVGVGKTEFLKDTALHLAQCHEQNVGMVFLEQPPTETVLRLAGSMLGKMLHVPGTEWRQEEVTGCLEGLEGRVHFYDHFGSTEFDTVANKIRYMVTGLGCKYIFLDHITALAADMKDERRGLDSVMARLAGLVTELNFSLILVSHLSTPQGELSHEEGARVMEKHFTGSRAIARWSHFMLGLERDKQAEDELTRRTTTVRMLKDRLTGASVGEIIPLTLDAKQCRLVELVEYVNGDTSDQTF